MAGGTLALVARAPSPFAVAVTAVVGAVGGLVAVRSSGALAGARLRWLMAVALGSIPFLAASTLLMSNPLPRAAGVAIASSVVAAVAEEVFFRRLVYGWLERWGAALAIGGSAALFAAIHVPSTGSACSRSPSPPASSSAGSDERPGAGPLLPLPMCSPTCWRRCRWLRRTGGWWSRAWL